MNEAALVTFAKMVVQARDEMYDELSTLGQDGCALPDISRAGGDIDLIQQFSKFITDRFIFKLMRNIEELEFSSDYKLVLQQGEDSFDISELSNGLAGEFMGSNGWYAKYSPYGPTLCWIAKFQHVLEFRNKLPI